jgi:hypothetical protein
VQDLFLNQKFLALYAIGEHTALLICLEFPDYNIQLKQGLSVSCVPVESTWNLCSGLFQMEWMGCLLVVAVLMNAIILLMAITMLSTWFSSAKE